MLSVRSLAHVQYSEIESPPYLDRIPLNVYVHPYVSKASNRGTLLRLEIASILDP